MSRSAGARLPSARRKLPDTALERPADLPHDLPQPQRKRRGGGVLCCLATTAVVCLTTTTLLLHERPPKSRRAAAAPAVPPHLVGPDVGPDEVIVGVPGGAPADLSAVPEDDLSALVEHTRRESAKAARKTPTKRTEAAEGPARLTEDDWRLRTRWYEKHFENATQPPKRFLSNREVDRKLAARGRTIGGDAAPSAEEPAAAATQEKWRKQDRWWRAAEAAEEVSWECSLLQQTYHVDDAENPASRALPEKLQARWTSLGCNATAPT